MNYGDIVSLNGVLFTVSSHRDDIWWGYECDVNGKILNDTITNLTGSNVFIMGEFTEGNETKGSISNESKTSEVTDGNEIEHPGHYGGKDNVYEAIKVIEAWGFDKDFCLGNVLKYLSRAGKKENNNLVSDLKKAQWYLNRKLNNVQGN